VSRAPVEAREALTTTAYNAGRDAGLAWDLDDFATLEDVRRCKQGWDDATINALGAEAFGALCGLTPEQVAERGEDWARACLEFNKGAWHGALEGQDERTGCAPRGAR
jgi:hypothetical protein